MSEPTSLYNHYLNTAARLFEETRSQFTRTPEHRRQALIPRLQTLQNRIAFANTNPQGFTQAAALTEISQGLLLLGGGTPIPNTDLIDAFIPASR